MTSDRRAASDRSASSRVHLSCRPPMSPPQCPLTPNTFPRGSLLTRRCSLEMRTRGSLSGPCDTLDTLLSPRQPKDIDPRQYGFRMFATVKTPDKRYAEIVNCGLWVASGVWHGEELIIE